MKLDKQLLLHRVSSLTKRKLCNPIVYQLHTKFCISIIDKQ